MVFIQLSEAMLLAGIMSGANSSVQHVALNTQKDFVARDTLCRAATSFKTKPCVRKKKGGGDQQIFQRMCKKSKPLIFFLSPSIPYHIVQCQSTQVFHSLSLCGQYLLIGLVVCLQLETHQSIIGQIYTTFARRGGKSQLKPLLDQL